MTTQPHRTGRSLRRAAAALLPALAFGLAGAMFVPAVLGFERYVITSGSMTGSFDRGSIVYADAVPVSELEVGDVITYTPPPDSGKRGKITHRIHAIRQGGNGPVLRTKGDANRTADPWTFTLHQPTQARVAFHLPYLGYAFAALSEPKVRMLVIGLPALLLALSVLAGLWREASANTVKPGRTGLDGEAPAVSAAQTGAS